jgi:TolB-like protein/Flp pilus assembly protein TadD
MTRATGTRLGPYEILAPLGAGGMGEVYRARDSKLDRDVAIKVLPDSVAADPEALARFEREAKAVAALSHPNILSIFDYGSEGGVSFAVMELLEGETLRGKLDAGFIAPLQAVDYALQIARGLSAAHERGIVHRDVKPENVFVSRDGHVKILDFGLAKKVEPAAPGAETSAPTTTGHTEPGTVMGTVGYMSPEQVRGLPVDHRSDIFSFGAILYELLTGRRAFKKETASDTMAAILRDDPPELSESGRNLSVALDHVVRHCLEKDRDRRFQSARDVAFALSEASGAAATATAATAAAPGFAATGAQTIPRTSPKKRAWALVLALVVAAGAGVFLARSFLRGGAEAAGMRVAVLPFENMGASEDDYFADGIADEVRGKLTGIPGLQVIARASSTPYKKTTKTPRQIAEELHAPYLLTGTVRWEKAGGASRVHVTPELVDVTRPDAPTSKWQQAFDASLTDVFAVQSDIATRVAQALGSAIGASEAKQLADRPTQNLAAYDAFLKGRAAQGAGATTDPATLRKSLGFYEQAVALDPSFATAWAELSHAATSVYANGVPTAALAARAKEAAEKAVALAPQKPDGYSALGTYERLVKNDLPRAAEQFEKGWRLAPGETRFLVATAQVEQGLGRWDSSVDRLRQAERLNPRSVPTARILGSTCLRLRRYQEAREALDRALALAPTNPDAIEYKAMTYVAEGDVAGARRVLEGALKIADPTEMVASFASYYALGWVLDERSRDLLLRLSPSAFDDDRGHWAVCLSDAYALRGDTASARRYAEEAAKAFAEQLVAAPEDAGRHAELGLALARLGRKKEAIREGERAAVLDPVSKDKLYAPFTQHQLALIYALVGEQEKALDQLEPLLKMPYFLSPGWLKVDPAFDPLRKNPRFQKLVGDRS